MIIYDDEAPEIIDLQVETIKGDRGERGEKGERGERGENGKDGNHGLSIQGPEGKQGERGDKGEPGEPGKDGKNGIDGKPGPEGRKGEKGDQGVPGKEPIIDFGEGKDFDRLKINGIVKGPHLSAKEAGRSKFVQYIGGENFWKKTGNILTPLNEPTLLDCSKMVVNVEGIQLDLVNDLPNSVGLISWDATNKTAKLGLENGSELQIGQEQNFQGKNIENVTITDGSPVYIFSASSGIRNIKYATASIFDVSEKTIGLATQNILKNEFGYVTTFGLVNDVNTIAWSEGDTLWLSDTSGQLSNVKPASNNLIRIGMVVYSHAVNGKIFVNVNHEHQKFGDVDAGNFSEIEPDGTLVFNGDATVYDDVYPAAVATNTTGANIPAFTNYVGNLKGYEFLGATLLKELQIQWQIYHSYEEGTNILPHIHIYIPDNAIGGTIKFYLEYEWTNVWDTGAPTITTTSGTVIRTANQGISSNHILAFPEITGTGKTLSSCFGARLYRNPADPDDTFSSSVWLRSADIHIKKNTIGSRQEYIK